MRESVTVKTYLHTDYTGPLQGLFCVCAKFRLHVQSDIIKTLLEP